VLAPNGHSAYPTIFATLERYEVRTYYFRVPRSQLQSSKRDFVVNLRVSLMSLLPHRTSHQFHGILITNIWNYNLPYSQFGPHQYHN
jgi:hypothetical protein